MVTEIIDKAMAYKYVPQFYKPGKNPLSMTYEEYMNALKVTKLKSAYRKSYNNLAKEK